MSVPQGGQKAHHQAALAKTKTIPFGSEIRQAAVAAALRRHAESGAGAREQDLSARAVHIAALLAFRRLLADCRVPFGIRCPDPLAACPRFEISLGGLPVLLARSRDPAGSPLRLTGPGNDWNENDRSGNRAIVLIYTAAGSGESGPIPAPGPFVQHPDREPLQQVVSAGEVGIRGKRAAPGDDAADRRTEHQEAARPGAALFDAIHQGFKR